MPTSANYYVSPISASNIANFGVDVGNIAAQQGGGNGLIFVSVGDNLEGQGIISSPLKTKDNIQVVSLTTTNGATITTNLSASTSTIGGITANSVGSTTVSASTINANSVTASLKGDGSQVTNITASNIPTFTNDVRNQLSAGANLNYSAGQFALNTNVNTTSVTASLNGNGSQVTNITASNISNFTNDTRGQLSAGANLNYSGGQFALNTNISTTSVTASLKGDGSQITNITASNIPNWTADVRKQISGSQYVTYNTSSGVVSLPFTGSILGTTPIILGQTETTVTGLTSISASFGTFNTLSASAFNLGTLTALTSTTGDLTVNNLIVNGVIENAAGAIQYVTGAAYQIIPSTSLVKISAPSGSQTLTSTPTIKTTGYNEGTRIFIVNMGPSVVTFKDEGAVTGTKLRMANQTYNQPIWGCIQFVLVSGSTGKTWVEAGRGA